jgi:hypothetical protein
MGLSLAALKIRAVTRPAFWKNSTKQGVPAGSGPASIWPGHRTALNNWRFNADRRSGTSRPPFQRIPGQAAEDSENNRRIGASGFGSGAVQASF